MIFYKKEGLTKILKTQLHITLVNKLHEQMNRNIYIHIR